MKKQLTLLLILVLTTVSNVVIAQNIPDYDHSHIYVQDFSNKLTDEEENNIQNKLNKFEKSTTNEICVVILDDLQGYEVSEFANLMFRKWGIGKDGVNNGIIILVSPENRKWRIEVGYGLEGYLTDGEAKMIGEDEFKPNFRKGSYYTGIDNVLDIFITKLNKVTPEFIEQKKQQEAKQAQANADAWMNVLYFIITLFIMFSIIGLVIYLIKRQKEKLRIAKENEEKIIIYKDGIISSFDTLNELKSKNFDSIDKSLYKVDEKIQEYNKTLLGYEKIRSVGYDPTISNIDYHFNQYTLLQQYINNLIKIAKEIIMYSSYRIDTFKKLDNCKRLVSDVKEHISHIEGVSTKIKTLYPDYSNKCDTIKSPITSLYTTMTDDIVKIEQLLNSNRIDVLNHGNIENKINNVSKIVDKFEAISNEITALENRLSRAKKVRESHKNSNGFDKLHLKVLGFVNQNHVSSTTKSLYNNLVNHISLFNKTYETARLLDMLEAYDNITVLSNSIESNCDSDIKAYHRKIREAEEERERIRRRKQREEEEAEDRRRRDSYTSSSSSSYYSSSSDWGSSSSSSDSSSSFGGGDSGGGGADGGW